MDSELKRRSAALEGFPLPTGAIDWAAREAAAWLYAGNTASGVGPVSGFAADLVVVTNWPHAGVRYQNRRHVYKIGG